MLGYRAFVCALEHGVKRGIRSDERARKYPHILNSLRKRLNVINKTAITAGSDQENLLNQATAVGLHTSIDICFEDTNDYILNVARC